MRLDPLRTFAKYLLSFRRRHWTVRDYPLRVRRQQGVPESSRWHAQVVGWWVMSGLGPTRHDAIADLERRLAERRARVGSLPRPGTSVPLEFASTARVQRDPELLRRLLTEVLRFDDPDAVWVSDESSLDDFCADAAATAALRERVRAAFGVDVSDVEDDRLATILERIAAARPR